MTDEFIQCFLGRGNQRTVTWLPANIVKIGNNVTLKGDLKPWRILEVWGRGNRDNIPFRHKLTV